MRRAIALILVIAILVVTPMFTIGMTGSGSYDLQATLLEVWRCAGFILWITCVLFIRNMISGDDLEQDYARIDQGNVATGVYRGFELFGVCIAGGLLLSKI